jgi:hypothetical protein
MKRSQLALILAFLLSIKADTIDNKYFSLAFFVMSAIMFIFSICFRFLEDKK